MFYVSAGHHLLSSRCILASSSNLIINAQKPPVLLIIIVPLFSLFFFFLFFPFFGFSTTQECSRAKLYVTLAESGACRPDSTRLQLRCPRIGLDAPASWSKYHGTMIGICVLKRYSILLRPRRIVRTSSKFFLLNAYEPRSLKNLVCKSLQGVSIPS